MEQGKITTIMDQDAMGRALTRIAHEIIERNKGVERVALVGVKRRGVPLANLLKEKIQQFEGVEVPTGVLDITLYRDDLEMHKDMPKLNETQISFDVEGMTVVIVDDVIFTGRTARAAIDAVLAKGRPKAIQLMVLVDRGHRELPIRPDYVGKNIPTSLNEIVCVNVQEIDGEQRVFIQNK